jgi:tRNA G18 (ribose-2'-O)-methylase SpoU
MQLNHYTSKFTKQRFPIVLISDNVSHAANLGSLFRTADAFGIEHLILGGSPIELGRKFTKTSRATEQSVSFEQLETLSEKIHELKAQSYTLIALEITDKSIPVSELKLEKNSKIAFVIGDENHGVSDSVLEKCDAVVHIEMYGQNSSMNVVQATSIALYEFTKKLSINNSF